MALFEFFINSKRDFSKWHIRISASLKFSWFKSKINVIFKSALAILLTLLKCNNNDGTIFYHNFGGLKKPITLLGPWLRSELEERGVDCPIVWWVDAYLGGQTDESNLNSCYLKKRAVAKRCLQGCALPSPPVHE